MIARRLVTCQRSIKGRLLQPARACITFPLKYRRPLLPPHLVWSRRHTSTAPTPISKENPEAEVATNIVPISTSREAFLPVSCPGCGAFTQWVDSKEAGYYSIKRNTVKDFVGKRQATSSHSENNLDVQKQAHDQDPTRSDPAESNKINTPQIEVPHLPVCDRCHNLVHHNQGISIQHPTAASIYRTILESPFDHNHVYHVLDAADFPMSLVPGVFRELALAPQRSKNRRSKTYTSRHGGKPTVSFIITRSDLLAPQKEQVDSLMPYLIEVLRDALGTYAQDIRLGNVHCVSARRGWWTAKMKEEIWKRGGGNWMVGKVNVGKSNLFEVVFPKGRNDVVSYAKLRETQATAGQLKGNAPQREAEAIEEMESFSPISDGQQETPPMEILPNSPPTENFAVLDETSLLPPAQPETPFPVMPIISSLPGTTASPIRLSFGQGRGELIDLPGISRGNLETFVEDSRKLDLVMTSRVKPEQLTIKPTQSLLLAGLIRMTPVDPLDVFLAYSFTPISAHITSTDKAIGLQSHTRESNVDSIAKPETADQISSAGTFDLKWDVTRHRAGPLTSSVAVGLKTDRLAFKIMATDILIEGCGWIEVTAQVRKDHFKIRSEDGTPRRDDEAFRNYVPRVEIFSPLGRHVASRRPMNAWLLTAKKPGASKIKGRPRKSMAGEKKRSRMRSANVT